MFFFRSLFYFVFPQVVCLPWLNEFEGRSPCSLCFAVEGENMLFVAYVCDGSENLVSCFQFSKVEKFDFDEHFFMEGYPFISVFNYIKKESLES